MNRKSLNRRKEDRAGLPANATAAIQQLIRLSQKLLDIGERETQALVQNDMLRFTIIQDEKESLTQQYITASEQFRTRIEEFRAIDKGLLARLEMIQKNLAEKSQGNNAIVSQMRSRAETNTHRTLLIAQEYGQQRRPQNSRGVTQNEGG